MPRKLTILRLDVISILNPKNLKAFIIFSVDDNGPLLFGMKIRPSSLYRPICLGSIILLSLYRM